METKYHKLYTDLRDAEEFFPKEDRKTLLETIKELYNENQELLMGKNEYGNYGVAFKTIHDDSKYPDQHYEFFTTIKERDYVFENYEKGLYYDKIFEQYLPYHSCVYNNFHDVQKVVKVGNEIYIKES